MNTKARTASVCIVHSALLAFIFAVPLLTGAYAQTSGPDEQIRARESGVYSPINTRPSDSPHMQQKAH
jgi:hypothetical protein